MFSPKFAVLAAVLVSLLMGIVLLSMQGAKVGSANSLPAAGSIIPPSGSPQVAAGADVQAPASLTTSSSQAGAVLGSATLDLGAVAKASSINDVDNVRWSLVRTTGDTGGLYTAQSGVDWKALRQVSRSGSFAVAAGSTWSFNATFQEGVGYKQASGVLAGGQCALATVIRGAAIQAGLPNKAKPHRYAIPGFALADSVNIWWGRDDLTVQNPTAQDLVIAWELTPQNVTVSIKN